jgi:hypothetical protein
MHREELVGNGYLRGNLSAGIRHYVSTQIIVPRIIVLTQPSLFVTERNIPFCALFSFVEKEEDLGRSSLDWTQ